MGLNPNQPSPNPVHSAIGPLGPVRPILPGGVFGGSSSTKLGPKIPRKAKITKQSHPENAQPPSIKRYMLKIAFQPLPKQSQIPFTYPAFMASTSMKCVTYVLNQKCYLCSDCTGASLELGTWRLDVFSPPIYSRLQVFTAIYRPPPPRGDIFHPRPCGSRPARRSLPTKPGQAKSHQIQPSQG